MVMCEKKDATLKIRLLPNRSATWAQTKWFLIAISSLVMVVAIIWAFQGAWVILPFAGLEVALLCYFLYRVSAKTYQQEILLIEPQHICLEGGARYPKWRKLFDSNATEFVITNPRHSLSPAQINIEGSGQHQPIGEFLNKEDVEELIDLIRSSGVSYRVTGKTLVHAIEGFDL